MKINPEKMSTEMETFIYEQPTIKKYGRMKELVLGTAGSGGDVFATSDRSHNATSTGGTFDDGFGELDGGGMGTQDNSGTGDDTGSAP